MGVLQSLKIHMDCLARDVHPQTDVGYRGATHLWDLLHLFSQGGLHKFEMFHNAIIQNRQSKSSHSFVFVLVRECGKMTLFHGLGGFSLPQTASTT
jgi:hypothetical protein